MAKREEEAGGVLIGGYNPIVLQIGVLDALFEKYPSRRAHIELTYLAI